jgi:hypothetical protein
MFVSYFGRTLSLQPFYVFNNKKIFIILRTFGLNFWKILVNIKKIHQYFYHFIYETLKIIVHSRVFDVFVQKIQNKFSKYLVSFLENVSPILKNILKLLLSQIFNSLNFSRFLLQFFVKRITILVVFRFTKI